MGSGTPVDTASLTPRAVETRDRILDAAESVFAQRGFDAATTREIAALFVHLSFSHIALAPLLSRVFGSDMFSVESIARQARVIGAAAGLANAGFTEDACGTAT